VIKDKAEERKNKEEKNEKKMTLNILSVVLTMYLKTVSKPTIKYGCKIAEEIFNKQR